MEEECVEESNRSGHLVGQDDTTLEYRSDEKSHTKTVQ